MQQTYNVKKLLSDGQWLYRQQVVVEDGKIIQITPGGPGIDLKDVESKDVESKDVDSKDLETKNVELMIPGYIDLQVNGGGGRLLNMQPDLRTLSQMTNTHRQFGTTAMLPTLITDDFSVMQRSADAICEAITQKMPGVLGVHFEGPLLNNVKKGIHPAQHIRSVSDAELALYTRDDLGRVLVTLAPDNVPVDIIRDLVNQGVKVCLGHSNASYEQVIAALEAGADGFTHIYNAMSPLSSRAPGMVGAALCHRGSYAGLILDHHHVHPALSKLAIDIKGHENVFLVSDAMAHVGFDQDTLPYFDKTITRKNGKLTVLTGTLAGSCLDMHQAVINAYKDLTVEFKQAVTMATKTPADYLGIAPEYGQLVQGARADFVLLDLDLNIKNVYVAGQQLVNQEEY